MSHDRSGKSRMNSQGENLEDVRPTRGPPDPHPGFQVKSTETNLEKAVATTGPPEMHPEPPPPFSKTIDETRNNIRKATDEARKDIPRYTRAANEYHEQTIQTAREIADNFLESQKEIINSLQSAWLPQIDAANRVFVSSWISPRHLADTYARAVSSFVDNIIAATRIANNTVFANMEALKTCIQNARDNVRELSRIGVNSARTFEQAAREIERQ